MTSSALSPAVQELLRALGYDSDSPNPTVTLSAANPALGQMRRSLKTAWPGGRCVLEQVTLLTPPPKAVAESLTLKGQYQESPAYLEITLDQEAVATLLLLVRQPFEEWYPAEHFPELREHFEPLVTQKAFIAVSHGLYGVDGARTVGKMRIDLSDFDFRDGLQILFDQVTHAQIVHLPDNLDAAQNAGITDLDLCKEDPKRFEIQIDRVRERFQVTSWWDRRSLTTDRSSGSRTSSKAPVDEAGYAIVFASGEQESHRWLRRVGTPDAPVVLEADIIEGFLARYTARLDRGAPLGKTRAALKALVPGGAALPDAPKSLTLVAFTYAPKEGQLLTVAAGDQDADGPHVVTLGPVELREVRYTVTARPPVGEKSSEAKPSVEIEGLVSLFGVEFDVKGKYGEYIQGCLVDPTGVHLGKLIQSVLPIRLPFGLDSVTIASAWVHQRLGKRRSKSLGPTRIELSLDGHVDLVPMQALVLNEVDLAVELDGDKLSSAQIRGMLTLGPVTLEVTALEEAGAWTFSGSLSSTKGISLKALVDHLLHAWGASVPDAVPDVEMTMLALSFQTQTRALEIQAGVQWVVDRDVPVIAGKSAALLDLTVTRSGAKGGHAVTAEAQWNLTKTGTASPVNGKHVEYTLDAHTLLSSEEQAFGFDLSTSGKPLEFSTLTSEIGLDGDIPPFAAGALDQLFQVTAFSVDYSRPDGQLDLAWTRSLGDGVLLSEYHGAAGDKDIEVCWNPNPDPGGDGVPTIGIDSVAQLVGLESVVDDLTSISAVSELKEILTFDQLGFTWTADGSAKALTVMAHSSDKHFGSAFFFLPFGEGAGFVAGLTFKDGGDSASGRPGGLPSDVDWKGVQGFFDAARAIVDVSLTHLLVSSVDKRRFRAPPFSADIMQPGSSGAPTAKPGSPFGTAPLQLTEGLSIGARVTFKESKTLRRVIDVHELDGQVTLGEVLALQASLPGKLTLSAGGGNKLVLTSPMLRISENTEDPEAGPALTVGGDLDLQVFGHMIDVGGWLTLMEESLTAHIELKDVTLPMVPGLRGVALDSPIAFELGLQFEPEGLDLGLSTRFDVWKDASTKDHGDVAFVLEMVEEIPQPLYVEFSIDELSIPAVLEAIYGLQRGLHALDDATKTVEKEADKVGGSVGKDAAAGGRALSQGVEGIESFVGHIEDILSMVELRDASLYWADSVVNRPDGTIVMPGVGFRGDLHIFDWDAYAMVDLSARGIPGFTGDFDTETIELGKVLRLWGGGKGVREQPKKVMAEYAETRAGVDALRRGDQRQTSPSPTASADRKWLVEPGGPVLHLSTRKSPFLHADLHAELFDYLHTDIHADISDEGFDFDFKVDAGNAVHADLECHWWHKEGKLEAHGDLGVHLHGDIGPLIPDVGATRIHLDTDLDAEVKLSVSSKVFKLTINGHFHFEDHELHIPELMIDEELLTLADLGSRIWKHVEKFAATIFEDIITPLAHAIAAAAKDVAKVAEAAARDVADVATAGAKEVAKVTEAAAHAMTKEGKKVKATAKQLAGKAEDVAKHAAESALETAKPLIDEAEKVGRQATLVLDEARDLVNVLADEGLQAVEAAAHYVRERLAEVKRALQELLERTQAWVEDAIGDAQQYADELGRQAEQAVRTIEHEISKVEHAIKEEAHEAEREAASLAHKVTSWI